MNQRHLRLWLLAVCTPILVALLAIEGRLAWRVWQTGLEVSTAPNDVAIVLGASVWRDQPSPVFAARIDYALDLLESGTVRHIIFTGGIGGGDELSESIAAARYAVGRGAEPELLRCETTSNTTRRNLVAARAIMQRNQWRTAIIVSDPLHLYRAMRMAEDMDIAAMPGPTPYTRYRTIGSQLPFFIRELFFLYLYRLQRLLPLPEGTSPSVGDGLCE